MDHLDLEQIQRFLKAKLSGEARTRIRQHLSGCPACRQAVNDERRFAHLLELADLPPLPPPAVQRVLERVDTAQRRRGSGRALGQAAILIGLPLGGFALGSILRQPPPLPPPPAVAGASGAEIQRLLPHLPELEQIQHWGAVVERFPFVKTFAQLLAQRTLPPQG